MKLSPNIDKSNVKYREYLMKKAALIKIVAFLVVLVLGAAVSIMIPLRPSKSITEKRNLSKFPELNAKDFMDGTYFSSIDTWFSDTFPGRDVLIMCNEYLTNLYGIRTNVISGEVVKGDDIPDVIIDETEFIDIEEIVTEKIDEVKEDKKVNYDYDDTMIVKAEDIDDSVDSDEDNQTASAKAGESLGSIFVVGDSAYNYYSFSQTKSDEYVDMLNDLSKKLEGKANVYSLIIPTSIDITLDDATRNSISSSNQRKAILYMYSKMDKSIGKCFVFDLMRKHRDEYVYFRTDHHWTQLGAYYAYTAFMAQVGKTPYSLDSYVPYDMGNFVGSFYTQTRVPALSSNPDRVYAYAPFSTNYMQMINNEYDLVDYNIITDVSGWSETSKYSAFIGGDKPFTEINNPNIHDGSSILIVKESFGNAFVPYIVENYENVFVIDYRYFRGTIPELVSERNIQGVLFLNNVSATSTADRIDEMKTICR